MSLAAFSYSRLEGYETCPRKFFKLSVEKSIKEKQNDKTDYGTEVHLAFANYIKSGKALPLHLRQHKPMLEQLRNAPGEKVVEQQVAINAAYAPTGWFDKDVYCRVISDLTILNGPKAAMFDWKTGKMKDDFTQLRLAGAVMFLLAEELEHISLHYVWTKDKKITTDKLTRDEMPGVWADLAPRIERYQIAHQQQAWPAKSGIHCRWCPDVSCPFNQSKK